MFLHQKLGYNAKFVDESNFHLIEEQFAKETPTITGFDTETDSLNTMLGYPFLMSFGFKKNVYAFEPTDALLDRTYAMMAKARYNFAHNCQYDFHMLTNFGKPIPEGINVSESMAIARLTQFADDNTLRLGLEYVGQMYIDEDAKMAGKVIKNRIAQQNKEAKAKLKLAFNHAYPKESFAQAFEAWKDRVQFVTLPKQDQIDFISKYYAEANYQTVYMEYPELVINYAMDDIVIMLEFVEKALPVLDVVDPGRTVFHRECSLIRPICEMEREGFKADVQYLLDSRAKVLAYQEKMYTRLYELFEQKITVGQHKVIIELFRSKWGVELAKADESCLEDVYKLNCAQGAKDAVKTIIALRTVDKWLSTYIDGKLNAVTNGRLYTSINNQGAVSGRVSCNLQQQPKDPLLTEDGEELFHPRKVFLADEGTRLFFLDFSQMELRVQAFYTMLVGEGDLNMCRAYIPFKCVSDMTDELFDPKNPDHIERWDSGEWVYPDTKAMWTPTDIHAVTAFNAYPHLENNTEHPDFKKLRKLGKMCNFLKNYQGGVKAIVEQMKVDEVTAQRLDKAYSTSFPGVKAYQSWVNSELLKHGFVENLYKRRYYMQNAQWFYKAGNYLIQGGCADMVKEKEIEVTNFLHGKQTRFILPIHDELAFRVPYGEEHLVPQLQGILQDTLDVMPWIPMVSEIEVTATNWAEKKGWDGQ